ncbi:speedy protein 1-A-like isoform X1 [Branchiostoma floridae x Branchiostoma japonicum]
MFSGYRRAVQTHGLFPEQLSTPSRQTEQRRAVVSREGSSECRLQAQENAAHSEVKGLPRRSIMTSFDSDAMMCDQDDFYREPYPSEDFDSSFFANSEMSIWDMEGQSEEWDKTAGPSPLVASKQETPILTRPLVPHVGKSLLSKRSRTPERPPHPAPCPLAKRMKKPSLIVKTTEMDAFFRLIDDDLIQDFLWMDRCCRIADKYLLAMVFAYFKRVGYSVQQYNRMNFFVSLYLANDMEEDEDDMKYEIFPWALGVDWRSRYPRFLRRRDHLWEAMHYRAAVSRKCCEEIMLIAPWHNIWQRLRSDNHAGATRHYPKDEHDYEPRGPGYEPIYCALCQGAVGDIDSSSDGYESDSQASTYLYLSETSESSQEDPSLSIAPEDWSSFNMQGLKKTLQTDPVPVGDDADSIWASKEE